MWFWLFAAGLIAGTGSLMWWTGEFDRLRAEAEQAFPIRREPR